MKIKSFAINNFKCINGGLDNNRIVFDDSNTVFIFGKNNVGKSTFLQGYEFYIKDEKANKLEYYFNKNMENVIEFELEVIIDNVDLRYIEDKHSNKSVSFKSFLSTDNIIKIKRTSSFKNDRGKIIFDIWVDQ
ncbi:MAG: hypothetical protein QM532_02520, partial [Cyanobium sp. MAG06]|nr:hypothetical protein [Cyanobium sp. MAG06]